MFWGRPHLYRAIISFCDENKVNWVIAIWKYCCFIAMDSSKIGAITKWIKMIFLLFKGYTGRVFFLFVFLTLTVCDQHNSKRYWQIVMQYEENIHSGKRKKWLYVGTRSRSWKFFKHLFYNCHYFILCPPDGGHLYSVEVIYLICSCAKRVARAKVDLLQSRVFHSRIIISLQCKRAQLFNEV